MGKHVTDGLQKITLISSPNIICVASNIAHLLIAKEDSIFLESFDNYEDTIFPKFRKIILELMK